MITSIRLVLNADCRAVEENQLRLDSACYVTPGQASQISQGVKTVALKLGKKSGRNEYGAVYGELYRKFAPTQQCKQRPAIEVQQGTNGLRSARIVASWITL